MRFLSRAGVALLYVAAAWLPIQYLPTRAFPLLPRAFVWLDDAALGLAALCGLAAAIRERRGRTPLDAPVAACLLAGCASAVANGVRPLELLLALRGPLEPVLAFYALWWLRPSRRQLAGLGALSLALALLQAPVAVAQFAATRGLASRDLVYGTFWTGASNSFAYYLLLFFVPLLAHALARKDRRALAAAALLAVPIALSGSRAAILLAPLLALVACWPWRTRALAAVLAAGLASVAVFELAKPPVEGAAVASELSPRRLYLEQLDRHRGMGRLAYAADVAGYVAGRGPRALLLGLGPGRLSSSAGDFTRAPLLEAFTRGGHAPVIPGQALATFSEYGLAGLAAFLWLLATGLRRARSAALDGGGAVRGLARGAWVASWILVAGMALEDVWELPHVAIVAWALVGACALAAPPVRVDLAETASAW